MAKTITITQPLWRAEKMMDSIRQLEGIGYSSAQAHDMVLEKMYGIKKEQTVTRSRFLGMWGPF